jgi:glycogen phosphorylase
MHRTVRDYTCQVYLPAHRSYCALEADSAARAKSLAAWISRVRQQWPHVCVEVVEQEPSVTLPVGADVQVRARVQLGSLSPQDVAVELCLGPLNAAGDIVDATAVPMDPAEQDIHHKCLFVATTPCARSGLQGLTVRVRPRHVDLATPFLPGLIRWADTACARG